MILNFLYTVAYILDPSIGKIELGNARSVSGITLRPFYILTL
jgi:hypothetical protein